MHHFKPIHGQRKQDRITSEEDLSASVAINGSKLTESNGSETLVYTKYNGTPQQLMDYLNK